MTRWFSWAVVVCGALASVVAFVSQTRELWPFTVDDTFITLRYARHLAEGHGLVWNLDEPPVEGYTSLLWTVLMALPHRLGTDAELFAKIGSWSATLALFGVVGASAASFAGGSVRVRGLAAVVAVALLAFDPSSAVHAVSGMDTALFAALLTTLLVLFAAALGAPTFRAFLVVASVGFLTGITRPEGNLVFVVAFPVLLLRLDSRSRPRALAACALGYAAPATLYFGWRLHTYGLLFPLPVYAKAVSTKLFLAGSSESWGFVCDLLSRNLLFAILLIAGGRKLSRRVLPAASGAAALYLASLKPAPLMAFEHRYLYPLVPWLCVLAGVGAVALASRLTSRRTRFGADPAPAIAGLVAMAVGAYAQEEHRHESVNRFTSYGAGLRRAHIVLGKQLRERCSRFAAPWIALLDAGAIAYYSGCNVIDTFGLNDRHIALHGRGDARYVLSRAPDVLVVISARADRYVPVFEYESSLFEQSLSLGYTQGQSFEFAPDYHLRLLLRSSAFKVPLASRSSEDPRAARAKED